MRTTNNDPSSFDDTEILMPDGFMPDIDSILSGEPVPVSHEMPSEETPSHNDGVKEDSETRSSTLTASAPDPTQTDLSTEEEEEDWNDFLDELKFYDNGSNREERCSCRIDLELSGTLEEIEILGYSRPDILSAIVRRFLKRHLTRLKEMRRVKKSIFSN